MTKPSQLHLTDIQQRIKDHNYFNFTSLIEPNGDIDRIDDPCIDTEMMTESVIQLFHPDEYEATITPTTKAEVNETSEGKQTVSNQQHSSKKRRNNMQSSGKTNLSIDIWKLSPEMTPNYSKIPKEQFKNLLCQSNPCCHHQELQKHLSNPKFLSFIQKYVHLLSMIFQLEMEKDYWKHVIDGLSFAVKWLSRMPKNLTRRYSINWDYPRTEHNIQHRQRLIENKLKQFCQQLRVHSQQYFPCWSISDQTLINQSIHVICDALKEMVQNDLENLHVRFEEKKILIQYDAYDIHLLKAFYDLHPTEDQKTRTEKIWRGKSKYCKRRIHEIKTNSFNNEQTDTSIKFNGNIQHNIDRDDQLYQMPFLESFDPTMRTIIEARQANIENRTQKIISFMNTSSPSIQL